MDDARGLTFVIGDVHGRMDLLAALAAEIEDYALGKPYRLIFLGDYIDRGPDSAGVIGFIRQLQDRQPDRVYCLKGNHEAMLLDAVEEPFAAGQWLRNGGFATLASFKVRYAKDVPAEVVSWLRVLPTFLEDEHRYYVHAGLDPDRGLRQQTDQDRLWMRHPFIDMDHDFGKHVVHGHSPVRFKPGRRPRPDERKYRTNLDTAAVFGGALTAAVFDDLQPTAIGFLQADQDGRIHFDVARRVNRRAAEGARSAALPGWRVASAALLFAVASAGVAGALNGRRHAAPTATATPPAPPPTALAKADITASPPARAEAETPTSTLAHGVVRPAEAAEQTAGPSSAAAIEQIDAGGGHNPPGPADEAAPDSVARQQVASAPPPEDVPHEAVRAEELAAARIDPLAGSGTTAAGDAIPSPAPRDIASAPIEAVPTQAEQAAAPEDPAQGPGPVATAGPTPSLPDVPWPTPPLPGAAALALGLSDAPAAPPRAGVDSTEVGDERLPGATHFAGEQVPGAPVNDRPESDGQPESDGRVLAASSLDYVPAAPGSLMTSSGPDMSGADVAAHDASGSSARTVLSQQDPGVRDWLPPTDGDGKAPAQDGGSTQHAPSQTAEAAPAPSHAPPQDAPPTPLLKSPSEWAFLARFVGDPDIRERNDPDSTFATASVQPKHGSPWQDAKDERTSEYGGTSAPDLTQDAGPAEVLASNPAPTPHPALPSVLSPQTERQDAAGLKAGEMIGGRPQAGTSPVTRPEVVATIDPAFNPRHDEDEAGPPPEPGQSGRDLLPAAPPPPIPAESSRREMSPGQEASPSTAVTPERAEAPAAEPLPHRLAPRHAARQAKSNQGRRPSPSVIARQEERGAPRRSASVQRCDTNRRWFFFLPQDCRRLARAAPHRGFLAMLLGGGDERGRSASDNPTTERSSVSATGASGGAASSGTTGRSSSASAGSGGSSGAGTGSSGAGGSSAGAKGGGSNSGNAGGGSTSGGSTGGGSAGGGNAGGSNGNGGGNAGGGNGNGGGHGNGGGKGKD